jgi:hypothetical protein
VQDVIDTILRATQETEKEMATPLTEEQRRREEVRWIVAYALARVEESSLPDVVLDDDPQPPASALVEALVKALVGDTDVVVLHGGPPKLPDNFPAHGGRDN